jgi:hypothetical protein
MFLNMNISKIKTDSLHTDSENLNTNNGLPGGLKGRALKTIVATQAPIVPPTGQLPLNARRNALGVLDVNSAQISRIQPPAVVNNTQEVIKKDHVVKSSTDNSINATYYKHHESHTENVDNSTNIETTPMAVDDPQEIMLISTVDNMLKNFIAQNSMQTVSNEIVGIDKEDLGDPQAMAEYVESIYRYLFDIEKRLMPDIVYMNRQSQLSWKHRGILVDWIVQVHYRFKMVPETLFMAVNFLDRFLSVQEVNRDKLQLVGITALLVASKYEEILCLFQTIAIQLSKS